MTAATPKFGCLMATLPSLDADAPAWAGHNVPSSELAADGVETEPHVTILYGFSLGFDSGRLAQALARRTPPALTLGPVSRFECDDYDVLKVDVDSVDLENLHKLLAGRFAADVTPSKWPYRPHLTLAYVHKGACRHLDGDRAFDGRTVAVTQALYSLPDKQGRRVFDFASLPDGHGLVRSSRGRLHPPATLKGVGTSAAESVNGGDILRAVREERLARRLASLEKKPHKPDGYEAFESVRTATERAVARAVARVVAVAEAEAAKPQPDDDYLGGYAADTFHAALASAYSQAAAGLSANLGLAYPLAPGEADHYAQSRADLLKGFPERLAARLRVEALHSKASGDRPGTTAAKLAAEGDKVAESEGRLVSEVEAQVACGTGQLRALRLAGYATAQWVTVGDDRVRETHTACEAQGEVPLGVKFSNGLRYPGDPSGPLSEVANCRCWLEGGRRAS